MSTTLDLKQIERRAFMTTFQDGLWDILWGLIVVAMAFFLYRPESGYTPLNIVGSTLSIFVSNILFWVAKKYITLPRMGQVRFGPLRRRKAKTLAVVLGVIILIQVIFVGLTVGGWFNAVFGEKLSSLVENYNPGRAAVAALGSLFICPAMLVIAYLIDFPRGYYIAVMMSLAAFLMILFNQPIYPIVIGGLIILPGLVLFVLFLRKYPLPQGYETNE